MPSRSGKIKVLIALSSNVMCEGVRKITAEKGYDAFCPPCSHLFPAPDIIILDSNQEVQCLLLTHPKAKAILLDTGLKDQEIACLLTRHKIRGIISPEATVEMFHKAIKVVNDDEIWVDQKHLKSLLLNNGVLTDSGDIKSLSEQDRKIIQLITQGLKNREIGAELCLSEHTIKAHVSRIYKRLNVRNRSQLVSLALE